MNLIHWFRDFWQEMTGAKRAARNIRESLEEADVEIRLGFGLSPRSETNTLNGTHPAKTLRKRAKQTQS